MKITKSTLSVLLLERLKARKLDLIDQYHSSSSGIGHFICDDILPEDIALQVYKKFPDNNILTRNKSLRESKYVGANVDNFDPIVTSTIFAFQSEEVINIIEKITGLGDLVPDPSLYAAGISSMMNGDFLRPHLDNAMNGEMTLWRNFNLLYYLSPGWKEDDGGHLELWPDGPGNKRISISPKFNRLVLMHTHAKAWHSVSPIKSNSPRICVSNYYFSKNKPSEDTIFHVTSFQDVNNGSVIDYLLKIDTLCRNLIRKVFKFGFFNKNHIYRKRKKNKSHPIDN